MKRFDLHTHTCFSDGTLSPQDLIDRAIQIDLKGLSITDHDNIDAYYHLPKVDFILGIGIEFSSFCDGESIHVLGYDFHLDHPVLNDMIARHKNRRFNRNNAIIKNLKNLGINISEDELYSRFTDRSVGRPHIGQLLIEKGVCQNMDQVFREYLGEGKKAYAQGEMISTDETIQVIQKAEGKALIAHPHFIKKSRILKQLLEKPFDGIEVFYARLMKTETTYYEKLAKDKNWLISGGSDFHGDTKAFNILGSSWVDEELFHKIFKRPIYLNH